MEEYKVRMFESRTFFVHDTSFDLKEFVSIGTFYIYFFTY